MLLSWDLYLSMGYLSFEARGDPSHMGTLPTEKAAAGFSDCAASSMDQGTSKGESEHNSFSSDSPSTSSRGLTGTVGLNKAEEAPSLVQRRMVLVTNWGMP